MRYAQTLGRIGFGLSTFGALIWVLWPSDRSWLQPEPLFIFATAFVLWVLSEVKLSEDFEPPVTSENDVRVAKELLRLHAYNFRHLLKDHDLFGYTEQSYFKLLDDFVVRYDRSQLLFHDKEMQRSLGVFVERLRPLRKHISQNTVPIQIVGNMMIGYKPYQYVTPDDYDRLHGLAAEANDLATEAWSNFDAFVAVVRRRVPDALNDHLNPVVMS